MPVDDFAVRAIGLGVLLPAFVSAAVVIAFAFLGRRWQGAGALGGPLALACAMWAGYFALELGPFTPAGTGWEWLPHLAVLALPAGWVVARSRRRIFTLPIGVATAVTAIATIMPNWSSQSKENMGWTIALAECTIVSAVVIVKVIPQLPKSAIVAAMIFMVTATSFVDFVGGNARFAQAAGVIVAALGAAAIITAFVGKNIGETIVRGLVPGFSVALIGFLFSGYENYFETALRPCFGLVALAPLALSVVLIPAVRRQANGLKAAIALGALCIWLAVALARAAMFYFSEG